MTAERQRGEGERLRHRDRLHDQEQLALVGAVGDQAGPRTEQQDRAELRAASAERDAVVGELQDQQGLRDEREPVADLRDQLTAEEQAEVANVQRLERLAVAGRNAVMASRP